MLTGFEPIISDDPKIMILGSMPSVTSLEKHEYYGFKHNRFWKIMQAYFKEELINYQDKIALIKKHHIILWDVIHSCEREGSLDSKIKNAKCNEIDTLLKQYPQIKLVICNGRKSYDLYQKYFKELKVECLCLPSTSNANRSLKESTLFSVWFEALDKEKLSHSDCNSIR